MKCEYDNCTREARWFIREIGYNGTKGKWIKVCTKHHDKIGDENIRRLEWLK